MRGKLLPAALLCLLLTGCGALPYPREMGDMALLRTVGLDGGPESIRMTASTGVRARGIQGEREDALVLAAEGGTLPGAAAALRGQSDCSVFFGYVDQLLVGEGLAESGLRPALDYFARDQALSLGAQLWVIRGEAGAAVSSGGREGADRRLETLQTDGETGAAALSRSAGEVYADLLERGAAYAPALRVSEDGAALAEAGYAVFREDALAGFLEGEAARGLELLEGKPPEGVLEEKIGGETLAVRITGVKTRLRFSEGGGKLSLSICAEAELAEYGPNLADAERAALLDRLTGRLEGQVRSDLDDLREWRADCAGLGARAGLSAPALWSGLKGDWPERFANLPFEVEVRVELQK